MAGTTADGMGKQTYRDIRTLTQMQLQVELTLQVMENLTLLCRSSQARCILSTVKIAIKMSFMMRGKLKMLNSFYAHWFNAILEWNNDIPVSCLQQSPLTHPPTYCIVHPELGLLACWLTDWQGRNSLALKWSVTLGGKSQHINKIQQYTEKTKLRSKVDQSSCFLSWSSQWVSINNNIRPEHFKLPQQRRWLGTVNKPNMSSSNVCNHRNITPSRGR